jgi:protease-4
MKLDGSWLKQLLHTTAVNTHNWLTEMPGPRPEWLVVELSGPLPMRERKRNLLTFPPDIGPQRLTVEKLAGLVKSLGEAEWLTGVVFRFEALELNLSTAFVVRRLFERLRHKGKTVIVYATQLTVASYYLASGASQLVMPEGAELAVFGFALEALFMKEALARLGVAAEKLAVGEYKNAGDELVRSEMSTAQREQYEAILDSLLDTFLETVAEARLTDPQSVKGWLDTGVTSASQAKTLGMIDMVLYEDELISGQHKPVKAATRVLKRPLKRLRERVAVIALEGVIIPGKSRRSPLDFPILGGTFAGSETLLKAFRAAEADKTTRALVLYVDSGGGSALASDLIWREVVRVGKHKPVVAVMGSVAASGGYYVLTHAAHIVAPPTTITGSIGVLSTKIILADFYQKYGFKSEALERGQFARLYSSAQPFGDAGRALVQRYINDIYSRFTARVAEGRGLSRERVDELGRGRVYTGAQALKLGLIDSFGDIYTAIAEAKRLADLPHNADVYNVAVKDELRLPEKTRPQSWFKPVQQLAQEHALLLTLPFKIWP